MMKAQADSTRTGDFGMHMFMSEKTALMIYKRSLSDDDTQTLLEEIFAERKKSNAN